MKNIKKFILENRILSSIIVPIWHFPHQVCLGISTKKKLLSLEPGVARAFYLGIPVHNNLGDLAQGMCIRSWLKKHYPERRIVEIETNALVNTPFSMLGLLKKVYRAGDIIVFQSGYTTTDLGGYADAMHRAVMQSIPDADFLMLPQTIYFRSEENRKRTSDIYDNMKHMLFLARDKVSEEVALQMFPHIPVKLYPDIVTTLIGKYKFNYNRQGVLFCCRNDGEKFYSDQEIAELENRCKVIGNVSRTDTTKDVPPKELVHNAENYIKKEIDYYAHFKVMITDRYHGTILALAAGTPVIIIKTNDHKVTTGAQWFSGIYDDYVHVADTLEDAFIKAEEISNKQLSYELEDYFEKKYYDNLPALFQKHIKR